MKINMCCGLKLARPDRYLTHMYFSWDCVHAGEPALLPATRTSFRDGFSKMQFRLLTTPANVQYAIG